MTSSERVPLFLLGVGFVGGTLLKSLIASEKYNITVLTRGKDKAEVLKSLGTTPLLGSLSDVELIEKATIENDIIVHTATADDQPSVKAILKGLAAKPASSPAAIYVHTSGTGELTDDGAGLEASPHVFSDLKPEDIYALSDDAPHRDVDLLIERAVANGEVGTAKVAVIVPPLIYGIGEGPFNKTTIQIPGWIAESVEDKQVSVVGKGASIWNNIHVSNLATAYEAILAHFTTSPASDNVYWFAETSEHTWLSVGHTIDAALRAKGLVDKPLRFSNIKHYMGSNSRSSADRLRAIGWKGDKVQLGLHESIPQELELVLKNSSLMEEGAKGSRSWVPERGRYEFIRMAGN